jgi:hypothetical protein
MGFCRGVKKRSGGLGDRATRGDHARSVGCFKSVVGLPGREEVAEEEEEDEEEDKSEGESDSSELDSSWGASAAGATFSVSSCSEWKE